MRILTWIIRLFLFVILLAFAVRNTDPVVLRFYFDLAWRAPLVALLLAFFAAGAVLGVVAMLGVVFRQRRQIQHLKRGQTPGDGQADHAATRESRVEDAAGAPRAVDG